MTASTFVERRRRRRARLALSLSTILCSGLAAPAFAQLAPPPPVRASLDGNGVDLFQGTFNVNAPAISMGGSAPQGLSYYRLNRGLGWSDNLTATLNLSAGEITVTLGGTSDNFSVSGSTYTSIQGNGATLSLSGTVYTYTTSDGTVAHFDSQRSGVYPFYATGGRVTDIVKPDGTVLTFSYDSLYYCSRYKPDICTSHSYAYRLSAVTNNYGYSVGFLYNDDGSAIDPDEPPADSQLVSWGSPNGASGSVNSQTFGTTTSGGTTYYSVTDPMARNTLYRQSGNAIVGITRPGSTSEDVTIAYASGRVSSVTTAAGTVSYAASDASGVRTVTVTDPASKVTTYTFNIASQRMTSVTDATSRTTSYGYDANGRLTRTTMPEGNYTQLSYDARGNVTETRIVAKSGSGLSDIVTSASYDGTCSNTATCNQPNTTTDARGNVTDYSYDATHGGMLTVTAPAPTSGAVQPKTTYGYTALQAFFGPSNTASGAPVYKLTSTSTCQTTASCAGTSDEVKTVVDYGPQSSGTLNHLLPVSITTKAGDNSLSATTTYGYDTVGNVTSVDGPLAGSDDTTTMTYDADRERLTVTSPDPDGAGALKRRAVKTTYNAHGIATQTELGTATGVNAAGFTSLQQVTTTLDAADRKVKSVLTAGGTTYSVAQYSYDTAGRPQCSAVRMNSATWGSLPTSACTLGTAGSDGPDRIAKTVYDDAGRPTQTISAYGVSGTQSTDATATYSTNGQTATATDANGNTTTYEYDGFDRLVKTRYPVTTTGSGTSSTTDYEQLGYDAGSNVTSRRVRDGQTLYYSYDALGRLAYKDLPGSEPDVSYSYDLFGRLTLVSRSDGVADTIAYDALGRMTSDGQSFGSIAWQYDLAGRRIRQTWNDGFYVNYDYLLTGEVSAIRENGATSGVGMLASYGYDDLGRRTGIVRGNGTTTSYGYDNASRLVSLSHDLAGTSYDVSYGFGYNAAGQIGSRSTSNDGYAWGGAANRDDASGVNGLNQVTSVGSGSVGYDGRGNLASTGSTTYSFTAENRLASSNTGVSLYYDPFGRVVEYDTSVSARMVYDGDRLASEIANPTSAISRRYVFGPAGDEPIVWYEGSGTGDRRWLHADERGSVVAVSDASGNILAVNAYDEYGVPGSGNAGRFQYTGQAYLSELGFYNYKARMYSSRLGRFMQTDPIGYGDGMNWYGYVGGDPVNFTDPSGLQEQPPSIMVEKPSCPPNYTLYILYTPGGPHDQHYECHINSPSNQTGNAPPGQGPPSNGQGMTFNGQVAAPSQKPQNNKQPASVPRNRVVCDLLTKNDFSAYNAWQAALTLRNPDGPANNWSDPNLRNAENMLYEAYAGESSLNIWLHQNTKSLRRFFGISTSPYSADALQAGYDGEKLYGMSKKQLAEWCNDTAG